ncbi:MAG: hypothetical protein HC821_01075 [Lewinella sp.]|nr:hypothetical protein [Lewinella sp.]
MKNHLRSLGLALSFCLMLVAVQGQSSNDSLPGNAPPSVPMPSGSASQVEDLAVNAPPFNPNAVPTKTSVELWLSVGVLFFGLVVTLALIVVLGQRTKGGDVTDLIDAMKYPIVTVILVGGLFLITAGYGNEQIAPIIGLMGTIAGYLMGRSKGAAN